ncbi:hypothetical protein EGT67_18255 [Prescottella agglutinans]|uniref:Uncharacterized protein n=1 Tax=Prescottella agglutinans TaxID=1644129 RepID=A0A3S3E8Q4_9NOCA|nr:hypothetical protein [Prescottella agglutinans]RVW07890.1 hypothetical protein EGT67_18255 [Prescottella agglutinans]
MKTAHLDIGFADTDTGSRVGGNPPACFDSDPILDTHDYLLTLGAATAEWLGDREVSVFVRRGFTIGGDDLDYPDIGVRAVLHGPSARGAGTRGRHPGLGSAGLVVADPGAETPPFVRIGRAPVLIQNEPTYAARVEADGYRFLFQMNEEGWPVTSDPEAEFVEEYLFGYGSVYFYGKFDETGQAGDIVAGFLDF